MSAVTSFDSWGDGQLERLRGHRLADPLFNGASFVGDFSAIWHVIGIGRAIIDPSTWRQSVAFSVLIAVESLLVNQGVKRLFRRIRPTETGDPRYRIRRPSTSSFPSGHASSGFFAAGILTTAAGWAWAPLWYSAAIIIAISRVYVRIHHLSDIVAGAAFGAVLGVAGSWIFTQLVG